MVALLNGSFEENQYGDEGDADDWSFIESAAAVGLPVFGGTLATYDGFEAAWNNNSFLFKLDLLTDVARPPFTTLMVVSKYVEDFSELWDSNQEYIWDIGEPVLSPNGKETFGSGWSSNEDFQFTPFAPLGDAITTIPGFSPAESFNTGWLNDAYSLAPFDLTTFAGLDFAPFATGFQNIESFEQVSPPTPFTVYDAGSGLLYSDPAPTEGEVIAFVYGENGNLPPPLVPDLDYVVLASNLELGRWSVVGALNGPMVGLHYFHRSRLLYWDQIAQTF